MKMNKMFVLNQWFSETPSRNGVTKNMFLKETTYFSKQSKIGTQIKN